MVNICWITENPKEFQKKSAASLTNLKPLTVWITTNCEKFLERWEYQTTLPASWEICMQVKKQQLEPDMEQWTGSKLRKEAVYCHPAYLCSVHHVKCWTGWLASGIKIAGNNINNLRNADDTILMEESKEKLKSLLMRWQEESEKAGLKLNIEKTRIIAVSPITSWQIGGETMETVRDFIFLSSKIIADGDCSQETKTLAPWKKSYDKLSVLKSRDITLPTEVHLVKAMVFPALWMDVWMWKLDHKEGWVPKNWCFQTVVVEKTLESPLDRRSNRSILKEISWILIGMTEAEAEASILWPPDSKNWLTRRDPDAGQDWRWEKKGITEDEMVGWHHWLNGHEFEQTPRD